MVTLEFTSIIYLIEKVLIELFYDPVKFWKEIKLLYEKENNDQRSEF